MGNDINIVRSNYPARKAGVHEQEEFDDLSHLTPGERVELVWQMTKEAYLFAAVNLVNKDFHDILSKFINAKVDLILVQVGIALRINQ